MQILIFIVTLIVIWKFLVLVWYICAWLVCMASLGLLHVVKFVRDVIRAVRRLFGSTPKAPLAANIIKFRRRE